MKLSIVLYLRWARASIRNPRARRSPPGFSPIDFKFPMFHSRIRPMSSCFGCWQSGRSWKNSKSA